MMRSLGCSTVIKWLIATFAKSRPTGTIGTASFQCTPAVRNDRVVLRSRPAKQTSYFAVLTVRAPGVSHTVISAYRPRCPAPGTAGARYQHHRSSARYVGTFYGTALASSRDQRPGLMKHASACDLLRPIELISAGSASRWNNGTSAQPLSLFNTMPVALLLRHRDIRCRCCLHFMPAVVFIIKRLSCRCAASTASLIHFEQLD